MYNPPQFTTTDPSWLDWLAQNHPFGTLVSRGCRSVEAAAMADLMQQELERR
jgi:predicted FMN-binding regulatory protein PaiB